MKYLSPFAGITLILLFGFNPLSGQEIICPSIDCGNLNVNFNNSGEVVFCEGSTITLLNESVAGFDYFIIEWGDGAIDTLFDYSDPSHEYDIPDSLICETPQTAFSVNFTGIAICDAGNSCQSGSYDFGIKPEPLAAFTIPNQVCIETPFSVSDGSCHPIDYLWDFGDGTTSTDPNPSHQYDTPGTYTISQTVSNTCGSDIFTRTIEVVGQPLAAFNQTGDAGCTNTVIDFSDTSNEYSNTSWNITPSGDNNWCFTDTLMANNSDDISVLFKQAITYTVELTATNVCGQVTEEIMLTFEEAPDVALSNPPNACDEVTITPADIGFNISGNYTNITWEFESGTPSTATGEDFGSVTFNQSGSINLMVTSACGELTQSVDVSVNASESINISPVDDYCEGSSPDTLIATPAGGNWSGQGVTSNGVFDPSIGAGTYTLSYQLNNAPCNNDTMITVVVLESEAVTTANDTLCQDSAPIQLTATPSGGSWSGIGITDPVLGTFDPTVSGVGEFSSTYTYLDQNDCAIEASPTVLVEPLPQITLPDTIDLCKDDANVILDLVTGIDLNPEGGILIWNGEGIIDSTGIFNSEQTNLQPGIYTIEVTYQRNACEVTESFSISLTEPEALTIDPVMPVCISQGTLQLTTNLSGGTWSGPGIDPATGIIDLQVAGGGTTNYHYSFATGTSCAQEENVMVEIIDLGANLSAGEDESTCEGPNTFQLTGASQPDGLWSGPGMIDPEAGIIDLTVLTPGQTYDYQYCLESDQVAGCTACAAKTLTYNPKPEAGFTLDGTPCIGETVQFVSDQSGLTYQWNFGDNNTSILENPEHSFLDSNTYVVTQIVTTSASCADTTSQELYITRPPTADFELLDDEGCAPFALQLIDHSFGDGISSMWCINQDTLFGPEVPTYVFDSLPDDTYFPIVLKVTNLCDTRIDSATVLVHPYPLVNFGISEDEGCSPFTPDLINISLGNPDSYEWTLTPPGQIFTDFEPDLPALTTPDDSVSIYNLELVGTNECGMGALSKEITIYPPDVEAFIELDTLQGCQPFTVQPQSFSTPGSMLSWEVFGPQGQITGGTGPQPELVLPDAGIYTIVLHASRCGTDSDTTTIEVLPAPEVNFTHLPSVCLGQTITFQNNSQMVGNSQWDFGDGHTSSAFSAIHTFDTAGVFTVTYTGESLINNCPATYASEVEVYGLPESEFSPVQADGCPPFEVDFTNESSGVGPLEYIWSFGDDTNNSLATNPTHTFSNTGTYPVRLIAVDTLGCFSDTAFATIVVHPEPVSAFVLSDESVCLDHDTILATNQSMGNTINEWIIAGQNYTEENPVIIPDQVGTFGATLTVVNDFGCQDSNTQTYEVLASPRAAFAPNPQAICAGDNIIFGNQSTFADGYLWNFGDGTGTTEVSPTHAFEVPDTFTISLVATATNGCPSDTTVSFIISNPNPIATFVPDVSEECGAPADISFLNTSTGNLLNTWTFGDGTSSTALNPVHTYDFSGQYEVQLMVTTDFGCMDTTSQIIDIYGNPIAEAMLSDRWVCAGEEISLAATPTQAVRYEWYVLPSLQPDTGLVANYIFTQPGTYNFRLIAVYNDRCRDTLELEESLEVFEQPIADFDFEADEQESIIGDVRFINLSEFATDFFWDLGDGESSAEFEPVHEYDLNRDIWVTLIASTTNNGRFFCSDTLIRPIQPEWIVSFEVPNAISPDYGEPDVRTFGAVGSGVEEYILKVYSPFGNLIWHTDELDEGHPSGRWLGNDLDNTPVPQGAYSWEAEVLFVNGEKLRKQGTVTVLR